MKENKPKLSRIPKVALFAAAEALSYGDTKHGRFTWKKESHTLTEMLDKTLRHISQFLDGEDFDEESKVLHLGSALADLAIATDLYYNFKHLDDRYKNENENKTEDAQEQKEIMSVEGRRIAESDMVYFSKGTKVVKADGRIWDIDTAGTYPIKEGDMVYESNHD